MYGIGPSGFGGRYDNVDGSGGSGGSGGQDASLAFFTTGGILMDSQYAITTPTSNAGNYGGGGASSDGIGPEIGPSGSGAVRIIWGLGRRFISTAA